MRIASLHVYPLKGARGTAVRSVEIGARAIADDRRFMLIDDEGKFVSQRDAPRMALLVPALDGDRLTLAMDGRDAIAVDTTADGDARDTDVWGSPVKVVDQGDAAAAWLTDALGTSCRLVQMAASYGRPMHEGMPVQGEGHYGFADAAPLLVASTASLADLNERLDAPVPMNRFRANIIVDGCEAFAEDEWPHMRIGDVTLTPLIPCGRCVVTTTDQATAERSDEPLKTLATYRKTEDFGVTFGKYFAHDGPGTIRVGDEIQI